MDCSVCFTDLNNPPTSGPNPPPAKKCKTSNVTLSETVCLPCGHLFHRKCITDWFQKQHPNSLWISGTCPSCRRFANTSLFYPVYFSDANKSSQQGNGSAFAQQYAPFSSNKNSATHSPTPIASPSVPDTNTLDQTENDLRLQLKLLQEDYEELRKKLESERERADFYQAVAVSLLPTISTSTSSTEENLSNISADDIDPEVTDDEDSFDHY